MIFDGEFLYKDLGEHNMDRNPTLVEQLIELEKLEILPDEKELEYLMQLFSKFVPKIKAKKIVNNDLSCYNLSFVSEIKNIAIHKFSNNFYIIWIDAKKSIGYLCKGLEGVEELIKIK